MKMRGDITIWLSLDVLDHWTIADRQYDGSGAPLLFSDMAIMAVSIIKLQSLSVIIRIRLNASSTCVPSSVKPNIFSIIKLFPYN